MPKKGIFIVGGGGFGKTIYELLEPEYDVLGFIDDNILVENYLGPIAQIENYCDKESQFVVAIGNSNIRENIFLRLINLGYKPLTYIAKNTWIASSCVIGSGVLILPGCNISSNCIINDGCILNIGSCLDHDVIVGKFSVIGAGTPVNGPVEIPPYSQIKLGGI